MKTTAKLFLSLSLLALIMPISACGKKESGPKSEKVKICMNVYKEHETTYFPVSFNLDDYINISDTPNKEILKMSLLFDANIVDTAHPHFEKSDYPIESNTDRENFYKHLGISDFSFVKVESKTGFDEDDTSAMTMGHTLVEKEDKTYDICFVAVLDSGGSVAWCSNFDVGLDDESYYEKTGEHPEWTNHDNHKGFDVAANRCLSILESYADEKLSDDAEHIFYVFGHSRGGAVGNLLGSKLIDNNKTAVGYLCAGPAVTTSSQYSNEKYKHIFSFINSDDLITSLLPSKWGFNRFGTVTTFKMSEYRNNFETMNGIDFPSGSTVTILKGFTKLVNDRSEMYTVSDKYTVATSEELDEQEAEGFINKYTSCFSGEYADLRSFVKVEKTEVEENKYIVKITNCPSLVTSVMSYIIKNNSLNMSSMASAIAPFGAYLNSTLEVIGLSTTSLLTITVDYVVCMHFYYSYITYANINF